MRKYYVDQNLAFLKLDGCIFLSTYDISLDLYRFRQVIDDLYIFRTPADHPSCQTHILKKDTLGQVRIVRAKEGTFMHSYVTLAWHSVAADRLMRDTLYMLSIRGGRYIVISHKCPVNLGTKASYALSSKNLSRHYRQGPSLCQVLQL